MTFSILMGALSAKAFEQKQAELDAKLAAELAGKRGTIASPPARTGIGAPVTPILIRH